MANKTAYNNNVVVQVIMRMWHFGENYFLMPLYALIHALPDGKVYGKVYVYLTDNPVEDIVRNIAYVY